MAENHTDRENTEEPVIDQSVLTKILERQDLEITEASGLKEKVERSIKDLEGFEPDSPAHKAAIAVLIAVGKAVIQGVL